MSRTDWDGTTRYTTLVARAGEGRRALADATKRYDWPAVFEVLAAFPSFVNCARPESRALYAPLHQAAHGGASAEVVARLLELGAWRTLRNGRGERALDVAARCGHAGLISILEPVVRHSVPPEVLHAIQAHFHGLIRSLVGAQVEREALRLPELEPLLELDLPRIWFAVPGMYGGFSYTLEGDGAAAALRVESWSRVVEGSEQVHRITATGAVPAPE